MKRYTFLTLLLLFGLSNVNAQSDTTETKKPSLTFSTIYANDVNYYGQTSTDKLPYVLGNASLSFPSGLYLSAGAYKLINMGSGVSGADLTAGFDFDLTKNLSGGISFSKSFFPDSSLFLQSANLNIASAALNYDWKWLNTSLNADYAIGDQDALFMTFNASKLIDLGSISSQDYVTIEPSFELVGGTQSITTEEEVPGSAGTPGGGGGNNVIDPITGKVIGRRIKPLKSSNERPPQYREIVSTSFDLLSYNISLPLAYNRGNYSIEATYQGSVLSNKIEGASQKLRSFLYLGFNYSF